MVKSSIPAYKTYLTILKLTAVSQLAKRWYPTLKYPLPKEKPVVRLNVGVFQIYEFHFLNELLQISIIVGNPLIYQITPIAL